MKNNKEIIEICNTAKAQADAGDNWADYVNGALNSAGVETDEGKARELCNRGKMNVVAVLADGRVVEYWDDKSWHVSNLSDYAE